MRKSLALSQSRWQTFMAEHMHWFLPKLSCIFINSGTNLNAHTTAYCKGVFFILLIIKKSISKLKNDLNLLLLIFLMIRCTETCLSWEKRWFLEKFTARSKSWNSGFPTLPLLWNTRGGRWERACHSTFPGF